MAEQGREWIVIPIDRTAIDKAGFCFRIEGTDAIFRAEEWNSEARVYTDGQSLFFLKEGCGIGDLIKAALQ